MCIAEWLSVAVSTHIDISRHQVKYLKYIYFLFAYHNLTNMERKRVGVLESDCLGLNSSCFTYLLDQFEQYFKSLYPQFLHVFFKKG